MRKIKRRRPRRCKYCKKKLPAQTAGRARLYCSTACRQAAYRRRQPLRWDALRALSQDLAWFERKREAHERLLDAARIYEFFHPQHEVVLRPRRGPPPAERRPKLRVIDGGLVNDP